MVDLLSLQQFYWASDFISPDAISSASSAAEASIVLNFTSIQNNNAIDSETCMLDI